MVIGVRGVAFCAFIAPRLHNPIVYTNNIINRTILRSLARDIYSVAGEIDRNYRTWCSNEPTDPGEILREIGDQLIVIANQKTKGYDPMTVIAQLTVHCRLLSCLTKSMAGTNFETRLRILTFEILNTTPDVMGDIIKKIPKNTYLTCSLNKLKTN